ncbi:MAG: RluA family pseudouridine synthase [Bacteroidales bacterium]|nr:RluA family pseudouridine synthase [Bacteroidales bacterium]
MISEEKIISEEQEDILFGHFHLDVDSGQEPMRVDKYMSTHLEKTSRNRIQMAIKNGYVKVGEKTVKANYVVRPGEVIRFVMPYERRGVDVIPQDIPLNIIYEDSSLLVLNKAAGMVVHPGHGHYDGTLVNALAWHLGVRVAGDDERGGFLVHRIDKDTSGLLVISKTDEAQMSLADQFYRHTIDRRYQAIVWGDMPEDAGTVDAPLERDPSERTRYRIAKEDGDGKRAVTHWKVLERFGFVTLVECKLETGRTHQIRVHMASLGHPLFNDEKYGGSEIRKGTIYAKYRQFIQNCFKICPRQALHAKTLGFTHPVSGKWMQFDSVLPEDMTALLEKWRKYASNMPAPEEEE